MNCNSGNNKEYVLEAQMSLIFVEAVKQSKIIKSLVSLKFYTELLLKDYNIGLGFSIELHKVSLKMALFYKLVFLMFKII